MDLKEDKDIIYASGYAYTRVRDRFRDVLGILSTVSGCEVDMNSEHIRIVEQALQRLEAIDNASPSEALEYSLKLYKMVESAGNGKGFNLNEAWKYHNTIKNYILKSQEQEKVLEILKEKRVDTQLLRFYNTVEEYNKEIKKWLTSYCYKKYRLTQEEFELLKRYL